MPALSLSRPMNIGRYEILDEIGQGAMGTVYRARDPLIERTVAIKTVAIAQLQAEGADAESRFLREAQSAGRLSHPNIVTIYDVGEADGLAYIAMEFLSGATLREVMNAGPMPLDLALDTALQMAEALAFAHEHGVIHRDVKPANVVVTGRHGRVKLTDFGIAHLVHSDRTHAGQMLGSPRYMSPEQAMGRDINGRSDVFSLGAVLYEMLTGQYAFDGDSLPGIVYRVINESPTSATALRPQLPAELARLLARMLSKQPDARPDARDLAGTLQALVDHPAVAPAPAADNRISRTLRMLAFTAPLGVFLLIGVGIIVINHFLDAPPHTVPAHSAAVVPPTPATQAPAAPSSPAPASTQKSANAPQSATNRPASKPAKADRPASQASAPVDAFLAELDKRQVELRIKRTELMLKYTEEHPDVILLDRQLEQLRAERRRHLRQLQKGRQD